MPPISASWRLASFGSFRTAKWGWKMVPAYVRQRGAPVRPHLWPALARLDCLALAVWGTDSDVPSEGQARRMVETVPNGELLSISGVGHAPSLVEPASLAGLERFLDGVLAPTGG
jgi:pimeloyl-ACP methyl ester carboxylesterase